MSGWTTKLPEPFYAEAPKPTVPVIENEETLKLEFAAFFVRTPDDPYKAAMAVFPGSITNAMTAANYWPSCPIVIAEMRRLKADLGEMAFLPTKAELARKAWELGTAENVKATAKERVEALRLFGEICGHIEKAAKTQTNINAGKGASVQVVASELDEKL